MKLKIILLLLLILCTGAIYAVDPWGEPEILSGSMTVMAQVFINDSPADNNDVLAAFVNVNGTLQLRGKAFIQVFGALSGCLIQIYTETNGEIITFKIWDESAQTVFNASQTLSSEVNGIVGSYPDNLYQITAGQILVTDPWGEPVVLTGSMTVMAKISISGLPATGDDILSAFVTVDGVEQLRGKGNIAIINGTPGCLLQVYTEVNGEIISFKVWDYSEQQILGSIPTVISEVNGIIGSWPNNLFPIYAGSIQTAATPTFFPLGGTYQTAQDVTITCATPGAQIRYTLNGTDPTEASSLYYNPLHLNLNSTTEIRAKAFKEYWLPSNIASETYIITGTVPAPVFYPPAGSYLNAVDVNIICFLAGAAIHYTLDGTEPDENSILYAAPVNITQDTLLKAKAYKTDWLPSLTTSAYYEISTAIEDDLNTPLVTGIQNVYPNPFTGSTTIELTIKDNPQNYKLSIYNIKGEMVYQASGYAKGSISRNWDGKDNKGNKLSAGVYLLSFQVDSSIYTRKLILK